MHPKNKRERREISKLKHVKKSDDRSGHVWHKLACEGETVKELDHELGEVKVGTTAQE